MRNWVLILSVVSVPVTLTHAVEDFSHGIPARFGLALLPAAMLLALGYAVQVGAAALSARDDARGHALNLLIALVWLVAAVADHLGEVLLVPTTEYRAGVISKALEVGIVVIAAAWAAASFGALRGQSMKASEP